MNYRFVNAFGGIEGDWADGGGFTPLEVTLSTLRWRTEGVECGRPSRVTPALCLKIWETKSVPFLHLKPLKTQ